MNRVEVRRGREVKTGKGRERQTEEDGGRTVELNAVRGYYVQKSPEEKGKVME